MAKAFLGEDADSAIALAIVGAAVAAAFVAFGGVVVQALKGPVSGDFTAGGFVTAAAVTLAGAFGELYVVYTMGKSLDLGGWENRLEVPFLAAVVLLCVYAVNGVFATLRTGTAEEAAEPLSEATYVAAVTTAYCCPGSRPDEPIEAQKILADVKALMAPEVKKAPALWSQLSRGGRKSAQDGARQAANAVAARPSAARFAGRSRAALL